jgi:hypothetical protein
MKMEEKTNQSIVEIRKPKNMIGISDPSSFHFPTSTKISKEKIPHMTNIMLKATHNILKI